MGNSISKRKKERLQKHKRQKEPPRVDITPADNEYSINTAQSVNSILMTSSQHHSALSQLNPDYPVGQQNSQEEEDSLQQGDAFMGKVEHPQQHKLLAQSDFWPPKRASGQSIEIEIDNNQLTVSSMNQLTMHSISSLNLQNSIANIDDYIRRLLDAGYATKVPKQLCLKASEVTAICRVAMDIFLSQP
ncbi:hypothetical protein A0J61_09829, partial [Choanephora cucurbitarum]